MLLAFHCLWKGIRQQSQKPSTSEQWRGPWREARLRVVAIIASVDPLIIYVIIPSIDSLTIHVNIASIHSYSLKIFKQYL